MMGAVVDKKGALLVMELMKHGSLEDMYLNEAIEFDGNITGFRVQGLGSN